MPEPRRIPPMSERAFQRRYMIAWSMLGAAAVVTGLIFGPHLHRWSHNNPWLCIVLSFALYAGSLLLCPVVLIWVWRRPHATPAVLFFAIPIGAVGLAVIYFMRNAGPSFLYVSRSSQYGLYTAVGLLYAASLIWSIAVGIKRKQMGDFDLPDYR
jgi:hypothetical protein